MIILYLTCANDVEATAISKALLEAKLIACARQLPVSSLYWWQHKINHADEILLMMESTEEKFEQIEQVVSRLHSYDEYVLTAVPVIKTTAGVQRWLDETLGI